VSAAECNNIKNVLKDDDALAIWTNEPHSTIFVQRVIAQLDQLKPAKGLSTGTPGLSSLDTDRVCGKSNAIYVYFKDSR